MAEYNFDEVCEPIDWQKDDNALLVRKIQARSDDAQGLLEVKRKQYRQNEAYFEGNQHEVDPTKPKPIYNFVFPIIRNMAGLLTDVKPKPAIKVVKLGANADKQIIEQYLELADNTEKSLEDWWENNKMQSRLQRLVLSLFIVDDFFLMPYWSTEKDDVDVHPVHPRDIRIDPNAAEMDEAEYAIVDLYKSRKWIKAQFPDLPKDEAKKITYMDYTEAQTQEAVDASNKEYKRLKSVARVELYMEPEWFVYKVGDIILKKFRNPFWALNEEEQRNQISEKIKARYERKGIKGAVGAVVDTMKDAMGMDTNATKMQGEIDAALQVLQPVSNYFTVPKIPLIHFDTYRLYGEMYSRSVLKQAAPTIDDMNKRKESISRSAESLGEPTIFVAGGEVSEEQVRKMKTRSDRPIRVPTKSNRSIRDVMHVQPGTPVPEQFFADIQHDERSVDNLFGHHEVSKGVADPRNKTKGGILALQEADQTPVRFLTRNIEDAMQDIFRWVIQIRKIHQKEVGVGDALDAKYVNYDRIDGHIQVFVKSGSMMPVSREQQRADAMDLYRVQAIDPLTLHERLGDPHAEQTAERLQAWLANRQILGDGANDAQERALEQIQMIMAGDMEGAQPQPGDDPKVHHDMLIMALRSNQFKDPEQEKMAADMVKYYAQVAGQPVATGPTTPNQ